MSKKKKSTTGPSKAALPHINAATSSLTQTYQQNQPQLQAIASDIQSKLPALGAKAFGGNDMVEAGQDYNTDVLGGKYLGQGNPYLEQMIAKTKGSVADGINSQFGKAGRTGGNHHVGELGERMAQAELGLRYGDYEGERNRMSTAAGQVPGLAQAEFAGVMPYVAAAQAGAEIPYIGSNNLARGIAGLWGNATTTTEKKGLGAYLLDAATAAAAAYAGGAGASDRRLKTNIEKVGELDDGLGVYAWDYRHDMGVDLPEGRQLGVMADEVEALRPWALGPLIAGEYASVHYGRL